MSEKVLKEFLVKKVYVQIVKHSKGEQVSLSEIVNIMSFVRMDKQLAKKFIGLLEEYNLIKKTSKYNFLLIKPLPKDEIPV